MGNKDRQQRLDALRLREAEGILTEAERAEIEALFATLDAEEAEASSLKKRSWSAPFLLICGREYPATGRRRGSPTRATRSARPGRLARASTRGALIGAAFSRQYSGRFMTKKHLMCPLDKSHSWDYNQQ
jgi:hypothetical protein